MDLRYNEDIRAMDRMKTSKTTACDSTALRSYGSRATGGTMPALTHEWRQPNQRTLPTVQPKAAALVTRRPTPSASAVRGISHLDMRDSSRPSSFSNQGSLLTRFTNQMMRPACNSRGALGSKQRPASPQRAVRRPSPSEAHGTRLWGSSAGTSAAAAVAAIPPTSNPCIAASGCCCGCGSVSTGSPGDASAAAVTSATCDACDGKHPTDRCPHFKGKARDKHPDAKRASEKKFLGGMPGAGPVEVLQHGAARVVRQPGDGSCLFHSLSYGLRDGSSASSLRREVAAFIAANPSLVIADSPLKDWVGGQCACACLSPPHCALAFSAARLGLRAVGVCNSDMHVHMTGTRAWTHLATCAGAVGLGLLGGRLLSAHGDRWRVGRRHRDGGRLTS